MFELLYSTYVQCMYQAYKMFKDTDTCMHEASKIFDKYTRKEFKPTGNICEGNKRGKENSKTH